MRRLTHSLPPGFPRPHSLLALLVVALGLPPPAAAAGALNVVGGDLLGSHAGSEWTQVIDAQYANDRTFDGRTFYVLKRAGTAVPGFKALPAPAALKAGSNQWLEVNLDEGTFTPVGTDNIGFHPERRLDDGSLILKLVKLQHEEALRLDAKGMIHRYPVSECGALWAFHGDGSYLRTDRGHCLNLRNGSPFEGAADGNPARLYYAKDGVHETRLAGAAMLAAPRFVAGGSHAVVWATSELKAGEPIAWDLLSIELASGKSSVIGRYDSQVTYNPADYAAGHGPLVQDPQGFFATWEAQSWVLYFPRREKPGTVQAVVLHDVRTGEEKRLELPGQRYYLPAPGSAQMTLVTLDESSDPKSLKAWELPSLKLLSTASFPPRGAPASAGTRLRDYLIKAFYSPGEQ